MAPGWCLSRAADARAPAAVPNSVLPLPCHNTSAAVEKAMKALLIQRHVQFPYVHDIAELLTVLEAADQEIPPAIRQAERLTRFAVFTRSKV